MPRIRILLLAALAAALLAIPATAQAQSGVRLRGTVTLKDASHRLVSVRATKRAFLLRVQSSMQRIRKGQRVELRGSTLRTPGQSSHVLASNVSILRSHPLAQAPSTSASDDDQPGSETADDDNDEQGGSGSVGSGPGSTNCTAETADDDSTGNVEDDQSVEDDQGEDCDSAEVEDNGSDNSGPGSVDDSGDDNGGSGGGGDD